VVHAGDNTEPLNDALVKEQEEQLLTGVRVEFIVVYRTPVFVPIRSTPSFYAPAQNPS
jgi:hypothetical protein